MKIKDIITESRRTLRESVHIVHPEDLIFLEDGVSGAQRAMQGLSQMASGRELTTIKWDGFPALVFGRDVDGNLMITDKHMFDKRDGSGRVKSPAEFRQYDANRGANRTDLYGKIDLLWAALEKIIPGNLRGFFMGDLLYAGKQQPTQGYYVFCPNTVTYKVKADSATGKHIAGTVAGIAVHTFIPGVGEGDQPLQGLGGLPDSGPVWFVSGQMPVPQVKIDTTALATADATIKKYATAVSDVKSRLSEMRAKGVITNISPYITSKIASGSFDHMLEGYYQFLTTKLSPSAAKTLLGDNHDGFLYQQGRAGLEGVFAIWVALYNLKMSIKKQIDAQQGGDVQAFTGDVVGHEGYVVGGGDEKFKLIDRLGFSKANFAKNG